MQLLVSLTILFSLSYALPIVNVVSVPLGVQAHPAISTYNDASNQINTLTTEVKQFNWKFPRTDAIYRHGMEALEILRRGNREVQEGPGLDARATNTLTPVLMILDSQTRQMALALRDRRSDIGRGNADLIVYTLLKQSYDVYADMRKYFVEKMPRTFGTPIIDDILNTISVTRDMFKPPGGDVTVVVVTPPASNTAPPVPGYQPTSCNPSRGYR